MNELYDNYPSNLAKKTRYMQEYKCDFIEPTTKAKDPTKTFIGGLVIGIIIGGAIVSAFIDYVLL